MLTKKQKNLLLFINKKLRASGVSPSYEEMKDSLNLKSKSGIHRLISALKERGFIRRLAHKARALEVIKLPETASANDIYNNFSPSVIKGGLDTENINLNIVTSQKKNITLKAENENSHMAFGDRDTVNTIIRNLTANALKYTKTDGTIKLSVSEHSDTHWKVSVTDDGLGISEENLKKLFSIDQKVKTDGTSGEKGTGLGLIICKEFSEKNEGIIGVDSELGMGSTFWFTVLKSPK